MSEIVHFLPSIYGLGVIDDGVCALCGASGLWEDTVGNDPKDSILASSVEEFLSCVGPDRRPCRPEMLIVIDVMSG